MALRLISQRLAAHGLRVGSRSAAVNSASFSLPMASSRNMSAATESAVATSALPSVHDVIVYLNVVDGSGARRKVPGIIGKTLYETCDTVHDIELGPESCGAATSAVRSDTWTEPLYGEGPCTGFDHVLIVGNGVETAKPRDAVEMRMLEQYWDEEEIFPESRLATQIELTREMDGMTVYVPDRIVDDIP